MIQHSRGESSKCQTDKAKVQSGSRQVIWDENSPPYVAFFFTEFVHSNNHRLRVNPDDLITFHLWCSHHPISSGIVASTETCRLHDLMARQGKLDDRESCKLAHVQFQIPSLPRRIDITLGLHSESKPPLSPQRSRSPRSPRRSMESSGSGSGTTESVSSSRSNDMPSELVINIRTIIRDSPKSAQEWNEARLRSLKEQQQSAEAGPSLKPLSAQIDPPYVVQVC